MNLKQLLEKRRWTQTYLATIAGVSQGFISHVCTGKKRISAKVAALIAKKVRVSACPRTDGTFTFHLKGE
jgi:transcriptional regulator with XRE-family HTH domain